MEWRPENWKELSLSEKLQICETVIIKKIGKLRLDYEKRNSGVIINGSEQENVDLFEHFLDRYHRQELVPDSEKILYFRKQYVTENKDYHSPWDFDSISRDWDIFSREDILDHFRKRDTSRDNPTWWTEFVCSIDQNFTAAERASKIDVMLQAEFDRRFLVWDSVSQKTGISKIPEYLLFDPHRPLFRHGFCGHHRFFNNHLTSENSMYELYSPAFCAKLMDPSITVKEWKTDPELQKLLQDAHARYHELAKSPKFYSATQARVEDMVQRTRIEMEEKEKEFKTLKSKYYELYSISEIF